MSRIHVFADLQNLGNAAAQRWNELATRAISQRGAFHVALAGGNTPRGLYQKLSEPDRVNRIDWSHTHVYFGDERSVPWDHPDSNFRMAREALLDHVPIPRDHIHPIRARVGQVRHDAYAYEHVLTSQVPKGSDGLPAFDLILLGMGTDGHVASLFPHSCSLHAANRLVVAVYVDKLATWRITITFPVLQAARHVLVVVAGTAKSATVRRVLADRPPEPRLLPARRLLNHDSVEWYLDREAAADLPRELPS
jgi:6-phosphogluconolactonase